MVQHCINNIQMYCGIASYFFRFRPVSLSLNTQFAQVLIEILHINNLYPLEQVLIIDKKYKKKKNKAILTTDFNLSHAITTPVGEYLIQPNRSLICLQASIACKTEISFYVIFIGDLIYLPALYLFRWVSRGVSFNCGHEDWINPVHATGHRCMDSPSRWGTVNLIISR